MSETARIYDIGRDTFGRRVEAQLTRHYSGRRMWRLVAYACSQRDETQTIWSLTDDNLAQLARALSEANRLPKTQGLIPHPPYAHPGDVA